MKSRLRRALVRILPLAVLLALPGAARADEGGISFWLPGQLGSLAALPAAPGWSFAAVYYHTSVAAGAGKRFPQGGRIDAGLDVRGNLVFFGPTYTVPEPVLGGQAAFSLVAAAGHLDASVFASITGPLGNSLSGRLTDERVVFADLYPKASLKWNYGVHNVMTYLTGNIPVGSYNPRRLANLGIGHAAIDGGLGYTYFNPQTGHEFSAVAGLTYNFENKHTDYKNGVDFHFDWGASQFLSQQLHVGLVGYAFQQLTGDSGAGATLGDFKSRVFGVGPQIGYIFPIGDLQGYLNLKGYKEFGAQNRPEGWNVWLAFNISAAPPHTPAAHAPPVRK